MKISWISDAPIVLSMPIALALDFTVMMIVDKTRMDATPTIKNNIKLINELSNKYGIKTYPTLVRIIGSKYKIFKGKRNMKNILRFIK